MDPKIFHKETNRLFRNSTPSKNGLENFKFEREYTQTKCHPKLNKTTPSDPDFASRVLMLARFYVVNTEYGSHNRGQKKSEAARLFTPLQILKAKTNPIFANFGRKKLYTLF